MQKHIANAMPTWARALDLFSGVVTSERIALQSRLSISGRISIGATYMASCTFPSLSPPITRESIYDAKDVDCIQLYTYFNTVQLEIH